MQIGRKRPPVDRFERELENLQGFLRGETVQLEHAESTIWWITDSGLPKVPVHVAAVRSSHDCRRGPARRGGGLLTVGASATARPAPGSCARSRMTSSTGSPPAGRLRPCAIGSARSSRAVSTA